MLVRFWGVRGSIPVPGANTVKYGGNTSCIEINYKDHILIIDFGTGARNLGNYLLLRGLGKTKFSLNALITHTHWDHIQGFPFFTPAFVKNCQISIWGPINLVGSSSLKQVFESQMQYSFFPVRFSELESEINFYEIQEQTWNIGPFKISSLYLNHTILCLGYRIECRGKVVVTIYDNEPYQNFFEGKRSFEVASKAIDEWIMVGNKKIFEFSRHADLLICDAQYTNSEYKDKETWGHSTINFALNLGKNAGVSKLALFHHDPLRTDSEIDELQFKIHHALRSQQIPMIAFFASEFLEIDL